MSHKPIPEFTETETPTPESGGMAWCPMLFWSAKGANFAVIKTDAKRYRAIFYYHPEVQLGTGMDSYDEIGDAAVSVLQVEADHMRKQKIKIDDSRDGGRSGPSWPSRGTTPSLEGGGKTASGDGRDAGGRATPGAVAETAADETPAKDDKAAPDKPDLSPFFWGD